MKPWVVILSSLLLTSPLFAADSDKSPVDEPMSIQIKETPLPEAMSAILYDTGITFELDEHAKTIVVPELSVQSVPIKVIVQSLGKTLGLTARFANNHYSITTNNDQASVLVDMVKNTQKEVAVGMNRYNVTKILGKPARVVQNTSVGCDTWVYPDRELVFAGGCVARIDEPLETRIKGKFTGGPQRVEYSKAFTPKNANHPAIMNVDLLSSAELAYFCDYSNLSRFISEHPDTVWLSDGRVVNKK